jgi:hemerythrin-like domain-containing protein
VIFRHAEDSKMPALRKARTTSKRTSPDAISVLKKDHEKVRGLLKKLESSAPKGRAGTSDLVRQIDQELKIHTQIEEEIFYPAFKEAVRSKEDRELYFEALEEHRVVDLVLPGVKETEETAEEFAAKAKVLKDLVEHHAGEEEKEMFPRARKVMERSELQELGRRLEQRKQELASS